MSDRFSPYTMQQGTFNPTVLQQQQQQSQQQQGDQHPLAMQGIPNPERLRIWQMMQQQMQQRPQGLGGDSTSSQVTPQMAEFLRSQQIARYHGGQQQQQQTFGLPMSNGQHPNFTDQTNNQATQLPANFGNMNSQTAHLQQRNALMSAFNSGQGPRQFDMMSLAQNQQNQNPQLGPSGTRPNQSQNGMNGIPGQNQSQPMLFSSSMVQHTEPHHNSPHATAQTPASTANMQNFMQTNSTGIPDGRRAATLVELKDHANSLQQNIREREAMARNLTLNKATMDHATFVAQMQGLAADIQTKKELQSKIFDAMKRMTSGLINSGGNGQQINNGNMQPTGSPAPPNRQPMSNAQAQAPWMQQAPNQAAGFPMRNAPQLPARGPSQPQTSPQMTQMGQSNTEQQRPGSTPHQLLPRQVPSQISPASSNQFAGNRPNGQSMGQLTLPPPLDKGKFDESFAAFSSNRTSSRDERLKLIGDRPVDLHNLHVHVMREGGAQQVTQRDLWPVIGARLGYVQFPGSGTEPARSGPGVSQQLQHIYSVYLEQFDKIYVHSVFQKQGLFIQQNQGILPSNPPGGATSSNNVTPSSSGSVPGPNQVQAMNLAMRYANMSTAEMRNLNPPPPEQMIAFVEANRSHLQRSQQQQDMLRGIASKPAQSTNQERTSTQYSGLQNQQALPPTVLNAGPSGGNQPPVASQAGQVPVQPTQGPNQAPAAMSFPQRPRPTAEQGRHAFEWVQKAKSDFANHTLPNIKTHSVPDEQREKFVEMMSHIHRISTEFEAKLPMFYYVVQDQNFVCRIIAIVLTIHEQMKILRSGGQKYILAPQNLPPLLAQLTAVNQQFHAAVASWMTQQTDNSATMNGHSGPQPQPVTVPNPSQQPQQPPVHSTPNLPPQNIPPPSNRPVNLNQPPPPKKKPSQTQINQVVNASASTPTPPASTPTSTANAATPATPITAPSPKTPKSPKGKAIPKPKAPPQPKRKSSKAVASTPEAVQPTAPSPSGSLKRQREEEIPAGPGSSSVSNAPSPKKARTEWEAGEAPAKKEELTDNIKTDEDASAFLERMTELIRLHASQGDPLTLDISETLDMILKGCGQDPSDSSGASSMAPLGPGDASQPSNLLPAADEFQDFLDFTSCAAEDPPDPSKPATPDLISSSSSTNPSPESATDGADAAGLPATSDIARLANFKSESDPDLLRLSMWKDIDGGESAYYQSDKWNWEGSMSTLEQPWAFAA